MEDEGRWNEMLEIDWKKHSGKSHLDDGWVSGKIQQSDVKGKACGKRHICL